RVECVQFLPDHLERKVPVPLCGEHVAQTLAVFRAEAPVPARGAFGCDQAFALEEPDLRHREVRELRTPECDDAADREVFLLGGAVSGGGHCPGVPARKTRRNVPIRTSSPFDRDAESTGSRLT